MPTQLPRVPSLIPSSFATLAIGRDVSITIFTASSLNSGEKLFLGRGNYFTFPDGPSYWMDCPEGSGHLSYRMVVKRMPIGGVPQQELCAAHADGLALSIIEFGPHPPIDVASLFRDHVRLLGTNLANWTSNPL